MQSTNPRPRSRSRAPLEVSNGPVGLELASDVHEDREPAAGSGMVAAADTDSTSETHFSSDWPNPGSDPGRPDGPTSYETMHLWADYFLAAVTRADPDRGLDLLLNNLERKVILTTHYSGMGTAEIAAGLLEDAAMHAGLRRPTPESSPTSAMSAYAASDTAPGPQRVLLSH